MSGTFVRRWLQFQFDLGATSGTFPDGTKSQAVDGLRASVEITTTGQLMTECRVVILGLDQGIMWTLTKLGVPIVDVNQQNQMTILAGSKEDGLSLVYGGVITQAWADIQSGPDVPFVINSYLGLDDALSKPAPTSVNGAADVATVMKTIASQMNGGKGYPLNNEGVNVKISKPYYSGSLLQQAQQLANHANIGMVIEKGVMTIWPLNTGRTEKAVEVGPDTGMIAYPTFTQEGLSVKTLYNPNILFGQNINVSSEIVPARGIWNTFRIAHKLESLTVNGKWETDIDCWLLGHTAAPSASAQ